MVLSIIEAVCTDTQCRHKMLRTGKEHTNYGLNSFIVFHIVCKCSPIDTHTFAQVLLRMYFP